MKLYFVSVLVAIHFTQVVQAQQEFDPAAAQIAQNYFGSPLPKSPSAIVKTQEYQYMAALHKKLRADYGVFELVIPVPQQNTPLSTAEPQATLILEHVEYYGDKDPAYYLLKDAIENLVKRLGPSITGASSNALSRKLKQAGIKQVRLDTALGGNGRINLKIEFYCVKSCTQNNVTALQALSASNLLGAFAKAVDLKPAPAPTYATRSQKLWRIKPATKLEYDDAKIYSLAEYEAKPSLLDGLTRANFYRSSALLYLTNAEPSERLQKPITVAFVFGGGDCPAGCNEHYIWLVEATPQWSDAGEVSFNVEGIQSNLTDWLKDDVVLEDSFPNANELTIIKAKPLKIIK